jgi:hypothetical protein
MGNRAGDGEQTDDLYIACNLKSPKLHLEISTLRMDETKHQLARGM